MNVEDLYTMCNSRANLEIQEKDILFCFAMS